MIFLHTWLWQYQNLLSGLLWSTLSILSLFLLILLVNLLTYPRLLTDTTSSPQSASEERAQYPSLSILIPARNEEHSIEECVRSLLAQEYAALEVLVLDDLSTDATAEIIQRMLAELPSEQSGRLQLLRGEPLPEGWVGKCFACHQLALHAQGELLFFTDADTVHAPETARAVVDCMRQYNVQLLSAHPEYVFGGLGERMLVPLLNFSMLILLPLALVPRRPEPTLSNGNGQLMCFQRSAYEQIGGHYSVKDSLIEDVVLARICKAAGYRMVFADASMLIHCRMYRSFANVIAGFSKSHFAPFHYSLSLALLAVILMLTLFVAPPLLAVLSFLGGSPLVLKLLATATYTLAVVMRILITLRFNRTQKMYMVLLCFLHPVSIVLECLILLNSIRWRYRKAGIMWKERYYKKQS